MRRTAALLATALLLTGCANKVTPLPSTSALSTPFAAVSAYGHEPTITFPKGGPPKELVKSVTTEGTGPVVAKGDLLVAHYVGQVWDGAVFDSSFKRNAPATFPIGVGSVIPGWDKELVGVKAGSRVLLSVPPVDGYGSAGQSAAKIRGTDTIVFVVDVIASYATTAVPPAGAVPETSPDTHGVTVTGDLGKEPHIVVGKGIASPTKPATVVLARGTGPAVAPGFVVFQATSVDWSGAPSGSTWTKGGITGQPVGSGGPLDALMTLPVGSRVLLLLPKDDTKASAHPAVAAVIDIVGEPWVPTP